VNIDKLIEAAKKIDALAEKKEQGSLEWQKLAVVARSGKGGSALIAHRKMQLLATKAISFDDAIAELRQALREK
jgi:hypothetical protein